jgi:hypothetical protein
MKKTPWFPRYIKPVRKGIYEIKTRYGIKFANWNGEYWQVPNSPILFNWIVQITAQWRGILK